MEMRDFKIEKIENEIKKLKLELIELKKDGLKKLNAIENGAKLGHFNILDGDEDSYYPCELLEVIDREKFIIKIREISINKVEITDVFGLYIEDIN